LNDIPPLKDVANVLRHQNENYDGTGYPDRHSATRIPLGSRILRAINLAQELSERHPDSPSAVSESLMESLGTLLDPRMGLLIEEYMRVVSDPSWKEGKRAVGLHDLKEGMVIASDLITGRGIMLLSKDSTLTLSQIDHLASLSHFDPIIHEIYVYDRAAHAA
jgi:adenylate cyclase